MNTITISKAEYTKLRRYSSAYLKIAQELAEAERAFPYDYKYIDKLSREARSDFKKGRGVEARSIDEALAKFFKK